MSKNARDKRPYIRPVTRLELSEQNIQFRWIAVVVLLAVGVVSIGYAFSTALSTEPGWHEVAPLADGAHCGDDFVLMYEFGADGSNPTLQNKALERLYGELASSAYLLFSPDVVSASGDNVQAINAHVNQPVKVDPALYEALELVVRYNNRHVFLAPVSQLYMPVFFCDGDGEAAIYDPMRDADRAALVKKTVTFCSDPAHVSLEILDDHQVQLNVSEACLTFAREYGFETFLDFGWMRNAFIADYMANAMADQGFTAGYLVSYDGFTRNLDAAGGAYSVNFFDRQGSDVLIPATLQYTGPQSILSLRDYPLSDKDKRHYYSYVSGEITTVFLDPADGTSKCATDSLMVYSDAPGCGELLLQVAPLFTAESLDVNAMTRLAGSGIYSIWAEGSTICHTQTDADLTLRPDSGGEGYSLKQVILFPI